MRNKLSTQLKKRLSLLLALIMVLSVGAMMDWTALVPEATAASGGNYQVRVYMQNHNTDSDSDFMWTKVYGYDQQGNYGTIADSAYFDEPTGRDYYSGTYTTPYFPTNFNAYWESHKCDKSDYGNNTYVQVYYNGGWQNVMSASMSSKENKTGKATYSCRCDGSTGTRPSINSVSITGGANQTISKDWHVTGTSGAISAAAYDQFGVKWYQNPTWSRSPSSDSISTTGNAASVTVSSSSWSDHSTTVTASLGGKSASTTVNFKWKHRLTVTNAGNGTSGTFDDYSGKTKALSAGSRTGYDFSSWSKSGTGSLNSTTSTTPTWTFGNGDGTVTCNWTIHTSTLKVNPNSGTWDGNTTEQSYTQNYNTTKSIPLPTKSGWTFTGWQQSNPFYGSGFNANAAFTYTFPANKGVTSTITATWKRDITNTYYYYAGDAETEKNVPKKKTALNTATTQTFTAPAASEVVNEVSKNDKTWTLKGWGAAEVWGTAGQTATIGIGGSHSVDTNSSAYEFYPVYALKTTKFYANFNYKDNAEDGVTVIDGAQKKDVTVNGDAETGAMPLPIVTEDGADVEVGGVTVSSIPRYYTEDDGFVYELQGWSKPGSSEVDVAYNGGTITLKVPGRTTTAPTTSTANLTPIELTPVYTVYARPIHVHFNYYDANGNLMYKDISGRAIGENSTEGTVKLPDPSLVVTSYKGKNSENEDVTYTLKGWCSVNNSEEFIPFNSEITLAVKPNPASDYYTYYPVYECTTTVRYYFFAANGAKTSMTEETTLRKYDTHTPDTADVVIPSAGFNKTVTLNGRTFTFCGWRLDTVSAKEDIATTVASENHLIRDAEYVYYAVYQSDDLALTYNTTHKSVTATPAPATQKLTQYISSGTGNANINNATAVEFTIAPDGEIPAKTGYTFKGWDLSDSESASAAYANGDTITIKVNTTLYARFAVKSLNVKFVYYNVNNGLESGFVQDDIRPVLYDDNTRDDRNTNPDYIVTAPTVQVKKSDNLVNAANIAHASDKYHYVFRQWVRSDGKDVYNSEYTNDGLDYTAKFRYVTDEAGITVQAMYDAYPHHYVNLTDAEFKTLGIAGDSAPYKAPICTENGYQYKKCSDCGHVYKEILDKLNHKDENGNSAIIYSGYKAPSCTETGIYYTGACKYCGEVVMSSDGLHPIYYQYDEATSSYQATESVDGVIAALNHDYQLKETVPPTCTEKGYELWVCTNDSTHIEKRNLVDCTGHTITKVSATDATCTEDGSSEKEYCTVCNRVITDSYIIPALGHDLKKIAAKAATCEEAGNREYYKCARCNKYYSDQFCKNEIADISAYILPALGHDYQYTEAENATCTKPGHTAGSVCSRCGQPDPEVGSAEITEDALGHQLDEGVYTPSDKPCQTPGYTTYTCTREGCCDGENGAAYQEVVYDELAQHTEQVIPEVPATCKDLGKTAYKVCSVCGEVIENFKWIPKTAHDYSIEVTAAVEPTCTDAGTTAVMKCSNCDSVTTAEAIPALGHNFTSWVISVAATCDAAGEKVRYCKRCGAEETETIPQMTHDWKDVAAVEATCYSVGNEAGRICKNCGAVEGCAEIPMTAHTLGEAVTIRTATCTLTGLAVKKCVNYDLCGYSEDVVTDALGHQLVETIAAVPATCTTPGKTAGYKCTRDDCDYEKAPENTVKLEHVWQTIPAVAPTCTEEGATSYEICVNCGLPLTESRPVPATGHQWGEWKLVAPATCTEDGSRVRICTVEGCTAQETKVLPKLGHHMTKVEAKVATCLEDGNIEYYSCSRCENIYYKNEAGTAQYSEDEIKIEALGHDWRITETVEPTCTTKGYTVETCANEGCGETKTINETDMIPHQGGVATCNQKAVCEVCGHEYGGYGSHDYHKELITEATCSTKGLERTTCSVCGKSYDTELPISKHLATAQILQEPTCTEPGQYILVCKYCGETMGEVTVVAATGHEDADGDGVCDKCGVELSADHDHNSDQTGICDKCGRNHVGQTGGFFGYNGFVCRLIAFFRMIKNLFKK